MEDSRSESGDIGGRSEPKNERSSSSPRRVASLELPVRRTAAPAATTPDDRRNSSPESTTDDRSVASVAADRRHQQQQPYNMTYYGGPHGVVPAHHHQLLQQRPPHHRHHHDQLQRQQHHVHQSNHVVHPAPADNLSTYPPSTGDDSAAAMETELYCSPDRDQYYGQYYTQHAAAAVKLRDGIDRL